MPCFQALYELKGLPANAETLEQLTKKKSTLLSSRINDVILIDRSIRFYISYGKVYLQVFLAPDEGRWVGLRVAKYLNLPSAEFVNDQAIYEAIDELTRSL